MPPNHINILLLQTDYYAINVTIQIMQLNNYTYKRKSTQNHDKDLKKHNDNYTLNNSVLPRFCQVVQWGQAI